MSADEKPCRILAVDFGERRTGLAATDYTGTIAVPLPPLVGLTESACARAISELARERQSQVIVVGLPLAARGEIGARAERTLAFVESVRAVAPCPVVTVDETFTTDEAHRRLAGMKAAQRKKHADSVAAIVILERYRAGG
jgi:putative Holliday junction resolvase